MTVDLARLGKFAGIGGIAIGAAVLILQPLIEKAVPGLESDARAQAVFGIAIGAFALGALGIIAWVVGNRAEQRDQVVKAGRDAAVGKRDAFVNARISRSTDSGKTSGTGEQQTRGQQRVKAARDAAVGGRDAAVNSTISPVSDSDRHGRR